MRKLPPALLSLMLASMLIVIELSFRQPTGFWFVLAPLFAAGWWIVSVVLHEAGHGAMAQCLGWRVVRLEAGSMIPFGTQGRFLGWRWKLVPSEFGGCAYVFPKRIRGYRWQSFLVFLAGPLANLGLVWAGLAGLGLALDSAPPAQLAACVLILTNLVLLVSSLRPTSVDLAGGEAFNDAAGMWHALTNRLGLPETAVLHGMGFEALARSEDGDVNGASRLADELLDGAPPDTGRAEVLDWAATVFMRIGPVGRAITLAREVLAITPADAPNVRSFTNSLAYTLLVRGTEQDVAEALDLARHCSTAGPTSAAYTGTLGAALVLAGHLTSGLELLDQSSAGAPRPQDRAENECWKALGYARAGRIADATRCSAHAERLDPRCFLLPQVRESLRGIPPAVVAGR